MYSFKMDSKSPYTAQMEQPAQVAVRLRGASPDDAESVTRLLEGDVELALQTASITIPYTIENARAFLNKADPLRTFAIVAGEELVGMVGLVGSGELCEIGYWIGRPYRRNGYATTAVGLLLEEMRACGITAFAAEVVPENAVSMRVLEKNGFARHSEVERDLPLRGGIRRLIRFQTG